MSEIIIGGEFKVIKELTKGRDSQLHEGISLKNGRTFAVKLQPLERSDSVLREATILRNIQQDYQFTVDYGLPFCHAAGKEQKFNYSLLDLLSHNLYDLLKKCGGIFKIKTFLMVADQTLKRLQFLHRQGYIHRNISLRKFAIGSDKNSKRIYLCGLGQGKKYRKQGAHMPYKEGRSVGRDLKYLSINRQLGIEGSRRDDLESLMYCWVKMLYGKLPWEDEKDPERVLSRKIQNSGAVILATFPKVLQEAYDYCRGLSFDEDPNYQSLRAVTLQLFEEYKLEYDYDYDWQQGKFDLKEEVQSH